MKVESIHIENFKRFKDIEISFKNEILDEVSDRYLILGDNGMGKTTLLQAIALPLACENFKTRWGKEVRKGHDLPSTLGQEYCREKIAEIVENNRRDRLVSEEDVKNKFRDLLPKFRPIIRL